MIKITFRLNICVTTKLAFLEGEVQVFSRKSCTNAEMSGDYFYWLVNKNYFTVHQHLIQISRYRVKVSNSFRCLAKHDNNHLIK